MKIPLIQLIIPYGVALSKTKVNDDQPIASAPADDMNFVEIARYFPFCGK